MPFTESNYENAVLQLFTQTLGYSYAYSPDIERALAVEQAYSRKQNQ